MSGGPLTSAQNLDRYVRQIRYPPLGIDGQKRLAAGRALVCGCGALGSILASTLVRAGVGLVRIVDRDFVETNNLQRQVLFDEQDVADQMPKAVAAAQKLRKINSEVRVEGIVADVNPTNVEQLCDGIDAIVDGMDNFETRFLVNDLAVQRRIPWVYGGCLGAEGQTMTILPGETACLRCLIQECPPPGTMPTCDTAGILAPIVNIIASLQANEAIKILSGNRQSINRCLTVVDIWDNRIRQVNLDSLRAARECPACDQADYPWLNGQRASHSAILCGRNAVQISPPGRAALSLPTLAEKLATVGPVSQNRYLVRVTVGEYLLTVFLDGRAIIGGTDDIATARTLYAKYIGA